ncbi:MAG: type II toxin-antitoxin system VapC family toxin [Thermomicrobiales bacterium]|nr:type II toxin-antitoxin system VapC family toxin [Thermomicrobiales bacterium]
MSYLVDTDVLIDAFGGLGDAVETLDRLAVAGLSISIVSYGEMFEGMLRPTASSAPMDNLRIFLSSFEILGLNEATMERFAHIRSTLRQAGQLIPDFDLLIAATSLEHDLTLITRNQRHFNRIPLLRISVPGSQERLS